MKTNLIDNANDVKWMLKNRNNQQTKNTNVYQGPRNKSKIINKNLTNNINCKA